MEAIKLSIPQGKKVYFASDFHLGAAHTNSDAIEKKVVAWLDHIKEDASTVFLLGDLFDFWFEYKKVVPKGFVRFLGKLAELHDRGIQLILFRGNHDMWMFDYLQNECGAIIYSDEVSFEIGNQKFLLPRSRRFFRAAINF